MSELYNRIMSLCEQKGVSGYRMCKDIVMQPSVLTDLKMGRQNGLSAKNADKIAAYFGVSVVYLLGTETKKAPTDGERVPHRDKRELLAGRGVSLLLDADAKLTDEQLDDIVNFIQFQQEKNGR